MINIISFEDFIYLFEKKTNCVLITIIFDTPKENYIFKK